MRGVPAHRGDRSACRRAADPGDTQTLTWREYSEQVRKVAAGLAGLGVRRGDTISLMMANRIEFYPLEVGAQHVGATSFSVYNTLPAEQLTYVFGNAGTKVAICEEQYVDRIRASGAAIDHIVCIDGTPEGTLSVDDLYAEAPGTSTSSRRGGPCNPTTWSPSSTHPGPPGTPRVWR